MQAGKNTAASAKERVANIGGAAKAGMDKTKATVQAQIEKMIAHGPVEKELLQRRKNLKIKQAELNKQEARIGQAAQKEQTRVAGHPTGAGVTRGLVGTHPIEVTSETGTGTNPLMAGINPGARGTAGGYT